MNIFGKHPSEQDLALFAGGELGPVSRWRIERHLESCAACKTEAAEYFHLSDKLAELGEVPDIDWKALAHNIQVASVQHSADAESTGHRWVWATGAALASATCLGLVFGVYEREQQEEQAPTLETQLSAAPASQADESIAKSDVGFSDKAEAVSADLEPASVLADRLTPQRQEFNRSRASEAPPGGQRRAQIALAEKLAEKKETAVDALASSGARSDEDFATAEASNELATSEWSTPDAQITTEGMLSFRRFDSGTGVMTITEYYAP